MLLRHRGASYREPRLPRQTQAPGVPGAPHRRGPPMVFDTHTSIRVTRRSASPRTRRPASGLWSERLGHAEDRAHGRASAAARGRQRAADQPDLRRKAGSAAEICDIRRAAALLPESARPNLFENSLVFQYATCLSPDLLRGTKEVPWEQLPEWKVGLQDPAVQCLQALVSCDGRSRSGRHALEFGIQGESYRTVVVAASTGQCLKE